MVEIMIVADEQNLIFQMLIFMYSLLCLFYDDRILFSD